MPDLNPKLEVLYKSAHRDRPLRPTSATALAEVVDEMVAADDFNNSYATVIFHTTRGSIVMVGVGIFASQGIGASVRTPISPLAHPYRAIRALARLRVQGT